MADDLMPCPFCGEADTIILNGPVSDDWCAVSCEKCQARGPINYTDPACMKDWNTRAPDPRIEALERERDEARAALATAREALVEIAALPDVRSDECGFIARNAIALIDGARDAKA